jgi:uncharacterized repeat protein (TIGR01451 family)
LTLTAGQVASCTITNDDIAPVLSLTKIITNDNGGAAVLTDFTLRTRNGATVVFSGTSGTAPVTNQAVTAGITYTLDETGSALSGYTASAWTCTNSIPVTGGNQITLTLGQTTTCTLTNNDIAPTIQLRKRSLGGVSTFSFSGTNGFGADAINTTAAGAGVFQAGVIKPVSANAVTVITETPASGYFISAAPTCTGATISLQSGTSYQVSAVLPGVTVVCDFTNTLAVPAIQLSKTPTPTTVNASGQSITYAIVVTNNGNVPVSSITVSDPLGSVICTTSGNATIAALAPLATENCALTYVTTQIDLDTRGGGDSDIDNTVSASGTYNATVVPANASAAVTLTINPLLSIVKTKIFTPAPGGGDVNGNGRADVNDIITYRYVVTNTGNVTMNAVGVNDAHNAFGTFVPPSGEVLTDNPPLGNSSDVTANNGVWSLLGPGDLVTFTTNYTVTQQDVDLLQ